MHLNRHTFFEGVRVKTLFLFSCWERAVVHAVVLIYVPTFLVLIKVVWLKGLFHCR